MSPGCVGAGTHGLACTWSSCRRTALALTAIQTTTKELFFRGYIVQGASVIWANCVFLALASAVVFTLPHLGNPEAQAADGIVLDPEQLARLNALPAASGERHEHSGMAAIDQ
jgi:hypothetical protein